MIRRLLSLLLVCLLMPFAAATAEESPLLPILVLYADGEPVGTAVLFFDNQTLLTSSSVLSSADTAIDIAGQAYSLTVVHTDGAIGTARIEQAVAADALFLAPKLDPSDLFCFGATSTGEFCQSAVTQPAALIYQGHSAIVFSADEDLLPGAMLINNDGILCGLVIADYGEGKDRYVAYTNEGLYFALLNLRDAAEALASADDNPEGWLSGVSMHWADGLLTVDWSGAIDAGEADAASCFTVLMKDVGNDFYTYFTTAPGQTSHAFKTVSGRTYAACVLAAAEDAEEVPSFSHTHYVLSDPIPVESFSRFDFENDAICVSAVPSGTVLDETAELPPVEAWTVDMLTGMDVYLQVASHYTVTETTEHVMLIALVTPDGACLTSTHGYIFAPEFMSHDAWHAPINDLINDYLTYGQTGTLLPGLYSVSYYIDGLLADVTSFTLE